jgi:endogenous inhibitor of DNA gyrase (YacG/DUF329 family)
MVTIIPCSFCGREMKRNVFCSGRCKVRYFRRSERDIPKTSEEVKEVIQEKYAGLCKHGAMKGLCKKGC